MYLLPFLCIGITYEIFHCFGTEDVAKEQLKISDIGKIKENIVCLIKKERILSGVLVFIF